MPLGRYDMLQSSETLVIRNPVKGSRQLITLCGRRSPSSFVWKGNLLLLNYVHQIKYGRTGVFVLQYEICEKEYKQMTTTVITHAALVSAAIRLSLVIRPSSDN